MTVEPNSMTRAPACTQVFETSIGARERAPGPGSVTTCATVPTPAFADGSGPAPERIPTPDGTDRLQQRDGKGNDVGPAVARSGRMTAMQQLEEADTWHSQDVDAVLATQDVGPDG